MQTLNVNEVCQVRVNRNLSFTQTWENNNKIPFAKDKCDSFVLSRSEWYEDVMVFRMFIVIIFV